MNGQNTSSAVMAQRADAMDAADDFPTPPWATRALLEYLSQVIWCDGTLGGSVWDPAANRGHMIRPLTETFSQVRASDLHDYGAGFQLEDYRLPFNQHPVDWIITNPPFNQAVEFIERSLHRATYGVAMLLRTQFQAGQDRYRDLFSKRPPQLILQHTERVVMLRGRLVRAGDVDCLNENKPDARASTATDYLWMVWAAEDYFNTQAPLVPFPAKQFDWIAPCRVLLERPGDYPEPHDGLASFDRERLTA